MKHWKDFKYKDECKLGVFLITYIAFIVFLFIHGSSISEGYSKLTSLMMPFVYGFIIAYLVNPLIKVIENDVLAGRSIKFKQFRVHRLISIVVAYIIVLTSVLICGVFIIPQILDSLTNIINTIPGLFSNFEGAISNREFKFLQNEHTAKVIDDWLLSLQVTLDNWMGQLTQYLPQVYDFVMSITTVFKDFLLGVFISGYMLVYKEKFVKGSNRILLLVVPDKVAKYIKYLLHRMDEIFGGFIVAKGLDSLIIGVLTYICCLIFRIPYSVLISVIVGITNMIPVFGPFIGGVVGAILLILIDTRACWVFCILILIIQQLDGNVIGPKIVGSKLGLASIWVLFGVIVVGGLLGVAGFFIGVPLFAVVFTIVKDYLDTKENQIKEKEIKKSEGDIKNV